MTARRGGILLFHDLKRPTAKALPTILAGLKAKGFQVVHLRAKSDVVPLATLDAELQPLLAKAPAKALVPFHGPIPPTVTKDGLAPVETAIAPSGPAAPARAAQQPARGCKP